MSIVPAVIEELAEHFARFPGVGRKSARRMAFYLLEQPREDVLNLAKKLVDVKDRISRCPVCNHITEEIPCRICSDPKRDAGLLCVVEDSMDVFSIEKTASFRGRYHVLGGLISPLDGVGPDDLAIDSLIPRMESVREIIFAVNPSVEGDTTAFYMKKLVADRDIKLSFLARGIPMGSDLEYIDEATLTRALEGRTEL